MKFKLILTFFFSGLFLLNGCGISTSKKEPQMAVLEVNSQSPNVACSHVTLSHSQMTPSELRELLHCFNRTGKIQAISRLADEMSDDELQPVAEILGSEILEKPYRLEGLQSWIRGDGAQFQQILTMVGQLTEEPMTVLKTLEMLRDVYFDSQGGDIRPRYDLLASLQSLAEEATHQGIYDGLDFFHDAVSSKAHQSFWPSLLHHNSQRYSLEQVNEGLIEFLKNSSHLGERSLQKLAHGDWWNFFDSYIQESSWLSRSSRMSGFVRFLVQDSDDVIPAMGEVLSRISATPSFSCLRGSAQLHGLTPVSLLNDVGRMGLAPLLMTLSTAQGFCEFPSELLDASTRLRDFSYGAPSEELSDLLAAGQSSSGFLDILVDTLKPLNNHSGTNLSALRSLQPLLYEMSSSQDHLLEDGVLILLHRRIQDRALLQQRLSSLLVPKDILGGASVFRVLSEHIEHLDVDRVSSVQRAWQNFFLTHDEKFLEKFSSSLLKAFQSGGSIARGLSQRSRLPRLSEGSDLQRTPERGHPFSEAILSIASRAVHYERLWTSVLNLSQNHPLTAVLALREFSRLTQEVSSGSSYSDAYGLIDSILQLGLSSWASTPSRSVGQQSVVRQQLSSQRASSRGLVEIATENQRLSLYRHNIDHHDLPEPIWRVSYLRNSTQRDLYQQCLSLSSQASLFDLESSLHGQNLDRWSSCLASFYTDSRDATIFYQALTNLSHNPFWQGRSLLDDGIRRAQSIAAIPLARSQFASAFQSHLAQISGVLPVFSLLKDNHAWGYLFEFLTHRNAGSSSHEELQQGPQVTGQTNVYTWTRVAQDHPIYASGLRGSFERLPLSEAIARLRPSVEPDQDESSVLNRVVTHFQNDVDLSSGIDHFSKEDFSKRIQDLLQAAVDPALLDSTDTSLPGSRYKFVPVLLEFAHSLNPRWNAYTSVTWSHEQLDQAARELSHWLITQANTLHLIPYRIQGHDQLLLASSLDVLGLLLEATDYRDSSGQMPAVSLGLVLLREFWENEQNVPPTYRARQLEAQRQAEESGFGEDSFGAEPADPSQAMILGHIPGLLRSFLPTQAPPVCFEGTDCHSAFMNLRGGSNPGEFPGLISILEMYLHGEGDSIGNVSTNCGDTGCLGLRMIRGLYSAIDHLYPQASFENIAPLTFRGPSNPLRIPTILGRTGIFRWGVRLLYGRSPDDESVYAFLRGVIEVAMHPSSQKVETLVQELLPEEEVVRFEQTPRSDLLQKIFDRAWDLRVHDEPRSLLWGLVAGIVPFQLLREPTDLWGGILQLATGLVSARGGRTTLNQYPEAFNQILMSSGLRSLVLSIQRSDQQERWSRFRQALIEVKRSPLFPVTSWQNLSSDLGAFLEDPSEKKAFYEAFLGVLVQDLSQGILDDSIGYAAAHDQDLRVLLESASRLDGPSGQGIFEIMERHFQVTSP